MIKMGNNSCKYFYNNMPISEYCSKHNLNVYTIKSRIFRLKKDYPNKNMDDIIDLAINYNKKANNKYYYQGISLVEYCKNHNLEHKKICERIRNLKKKNPDKSIDEIIGLAINFNNNFIIMENL